MSHIKIMRLELHNFARVYSGLGKTQVTLDFSSFENPINIFVGANGSGKSSIMRCLHPFAYNNAMGISDTKSKLIMEGRDGKKCIDIALDGKLYTIQHYYKRKKDESLSIESYIQEDGEELNENGTVTMFKDIVEDKLGVTESYLVLLSVGNSMSSFVDFTSADRKNFATKIFTDLAIFQEYYKKMSGKVRNMKALLNNVVDKLNKYSGTDKNELKTQLDTVLKSLDQMNSKRSTVLQSIGKIQNQLDTYRDTMEEYKDLQEKANVFLTDLQDLRNRKTIDKSKVDLQKEFTGFSKSMSTTEMDLVEARTKASSLLDKKESSMTQIKELEDRIRRMECNIDIHEMEELLKSIDDKLNNISGIHTDKFHGVSKDDLIKIQIHLDHIQSMCDRLLTEVIDESVILDIYEKFKKDNDLYKKLENKFNQTGSKIQNFNIINLTRLVSEKKPIVNCESSKGCSYYEFYQDYIRIINQSEEETNHELNKMKSELSSIEDCMRVTAILSDIMKYIKKHQIILSVPPEIFDPEQFIDDFMYCRECYNKKTLIDYIDQLELLEQKTSLLAKRKNVSDNIAQYKSNESIIQDMKTDIEKHHNTIRTLEDDIANYATSVSVFESEVTILKRQVEEIEKNLEICNQIDEVMAKLDMIKSRTTDMKDNIDKITSLEEKLQDYYTERDTIDRKISELSVMRDKFVIVLNDIETLEQEEIDLREKYDIVSAIRRAVSPTTGIPLEFIENYVKRNMAGKINELLDSVYHGRLRLLVNEIEVNDKEFTIPYMKNNSRVSDISTASDGERAILTLAFSLVLIQLSLTKYNIMLIDELDTTLDASTRAKFIGIIQNYMKLIQSDQVFLISHNNMFDMYRVNLIMTSEINTSAFDSDDVIELYK